MRIEIDSELGKLLDQVKTAEPTIYGRGHSETVRFLVNYYHNHKPLDLLLKDLQRVLGMFLEELPEIIETAMVAAVLKAMRHAIGSLFETKDENRTVNRSAAGGLEDREGR